MRALGSQALHRTGCDMTEYTDVAGPRTVWIQTIVRPPGPRFEPRGYRTVRGRFYPAFPDPASVKYRACQNGPSEIPGVAGFLCSQANKDCCLSYPHCTAALDWAVCPRAQHSPSTDSPGTTSSMCRSGIRWPCVRFPCDAVAREVPHRIRGIAVASCASAFGCPGRPKHFLRTNQARPPTAGSLGNLPSPGRSLADIGPLRHARPGPTG